MTSEEYKEQLSEALGKLAGVHAVGDSWITFDGSIPAGGVPFTGQLVTRAMYADLWAWVQSNKTVVTDSEWQTTANAQNGMNAAYSSGDGSTTFRLPCVVGGYLQAGDTSTAGQYVKEGLPNIWARLSNSWGQLKGNGQPSVSGAFLNSSIVTSDYTGYSTGDGWKIGYLDFNASRHNPIYGNSQHVTPETFKVLVGVYAFGVTGPVGESTEAGLVAEMNHKADIDASNFSAAGKNVLAELGFPSDRSVDVTVGVSGSSYTAPAHGYFKAEGSSSSGTKYILLRPQGSVARQVSFAIYGTGSAHTYIHVKKDEVMTMDYSAQNVTLKFIYAEGATDEAL